MDQSRAQVWHSVDCTYDWHRSCRHCKLVKIIRVTYWCGGVLADGNLFDSSIYQSSIDYTVAAYGGEPIPIS